MDDLESLLREVRACRVCAEALDLGPRPVVRMQVTARLLIVGQAPGTRVHDTGVPWNDPSGERLRDWLNVDRATFYDDSAIAIMPMGFCYPGRDKHGGDKPPRPECATLWHERLRAHLPHIKLTLLIGGYAQKQYLGPNRRKTMTETVRRGEDYAPMYFPLPHPSWRNTAWLNKNPWFEDEVLPRLRQRTASILRGKVV